MVDDIFGWKSRSRRHRDCHGRAIPKDINLYQSRKTIDNAVYAMKQAERRGLGECPDIADPKEFFDWFSYPTPWKWKGCSSQFPDLGLGGGAQIELWSQRHHDSSYSQGEPGAARKAGVLPVRTPWRDALRLAYETCGTKNPKITIMPQGANTFPMLVPKERNSSGKPNPSNVHNIIRFCASFYGREKG